RRGGAVQSRPLDLVYRVLLVDGIGIKTRDGTVTNRTVYVVKGINPEGERDILGLWVGPTGGESPKFWLTAITELKNRRVADVLMLCCDGLKGLPDSAPAAWPLLMSSSVSCALSETVCGSRRRSTGEPSLPRISCRAPQDRLQHERERVAQHPVPHRPPCGGVISRLSSPR
ncbi:MAG: hypothetical protein GY788_13820, partial [bacterium]|nr:hypothetical protein [bacterium]